MQKQEIKSLFEGINVWKKGDQRAPHKPLLLLLALGRLSRGEGQSVPYAEIEEKLKLLLQEFGPHRQSYHPELPFWYLKNDGLWQLGNAEGLAMRRGSNNPPRSELIQSRVTGSFPAEITATLANDPRLMAEVALGLLQSHFPETYHEAILQAVGLDLKQEDAARGRRDPRFREEVIRAYQYRCAVCGADVRIGNTVVALEAAHIKWHQAGGPDTVNNGFALCSLHHSLFDRGAFTVSDDSGRILVSEWINGGPSAHDWIIRHHAREIREPQGSKYLAEPRFLAWHKREVFRQPAREPA